MAHRRGMWLNEPLISQVAKDRGAADQMRLPPFILQNLMDES